MANWITLRNEGKNTLIVELNGKEVIREKFDIGQSEVNHSYNMDAVPDKETQDAYAQIHIDYGQVSLMVDKYKASYNEFCTELRSCLIVDVSTDKDMGDAKRDFEYAFGIPSPGTKKEVQGGVIKTKTIRVIRAALSQRQPDGWKLVPIEPTEKMFQAGHDLRAYGEGFTTTIEIYKAMVSAAPTAKGVTE